MLQLLYVCHFILYLGDDYNRMCTFHDFSVLNTSVLKQNMAAYLQISILYTGHLYDVADVADVGKSRSFWEGFVMTHILGMIDGKITGCKRMTCFVCRRTTLTPSTRAMASSRSEATSQRLVSMLASCLWVQRRRLSRGWGTRSRQG